MFIPIGDDNRDRRSTPYVNYFFILVNILVFIFLQGLGNEIPFTYGYSVVPAEIITGRDIVTDTRIIENTITGQQMVIPGLQPTNVPVYLTLISSIFMHGGIAHLLGNMLYLWIFGDNLEDVMGHKRYFFFYILCGIIAGLSHVFSTAYLGQNMYMPSLGASGAISGVLGGYIFLFPRRRVHVWLFFFFTISVPAFLAVGVWFVFQLVNGMGMIGGDETGGVAYAAHIGGFIAGVVLVKFFVRRQPVLVEKRKSFW